MRFRPLDLLRGAAVAAMIVVNNPGNWDRVYPQLTHAAWNGITAADLIFPAFIFIMGVSIAFTLGPRRSPDPHRGIVTRIAVRSTALIVLGLLLNAAAVWPHVGSMRIPGVLQRIGLTYAGAATIALRARLRGLITWTVALLLLHWMLLVLPLGFSASGQLLPAFNVGSSLDTFLFGAHLLRPQQDPEGVLGTLSSIATALAGVAIGQLLRGTNRAREQQSGERHDLGTRDPQTARLKVRRLVAAGLATAGLGALWATALPLNKALWTGSYALVTSGVTMVVLAAFAALDRASTRGLFAPLAWLGTNPLAIYFLAELCSIVLQRPLLPIRGAATAPKDLVFWSVVAPLVRDDGGPLSSLLYALAYTAVWVGLAGALRWRGIRLRL